MRGLMHFLKREIRHKIINVTDQVLFEREGEEFTQPSNLESYYERARRYVDENYDEPALNKLRNNIPLDEEDWETLERIFWSEVGTAEEYKREIHTADDEDIPQNPRKVIVFMDDRINDEMLRQILGSHGTAAPVCNIETDRRKTWGLSGYPLAMVYSPLQEFRELYDLDTALMQGTIFKELDLPFMGVTVTKGGGYRG